MGEARAGPCRLGGEEATGGRWRFSVIGGFPLLILQSWRDTHGIMFYLAPSALLST